MLTYSEQYKIRTSDLDYNDNMRISSYLDLFQTIAGKHADILGFGYADMIKKGVAWVITKVKFDCLLPLKSDETITVVTEPHEKGLMDFNRDYYIYNNAGELAAKGTSQWVHIDFINRKLIKPQADFCGEFTTRYAYPNRLIERIPAIDEKPSYTHQIVRSDLDHNGHTNNIRYADMMFNTVELPMIPKRVVINYHNESKLGDAIDIAYIKSGEDFIFTGKNRDKTCFTAKIFYSDIID